MNQARLYSKYNILQRTDGLYVLTKYLHLVKLKSEESILDIGCGDANVTIDLLRPRLPENIRKLVGADISNEMIEFAKAHNNYPKVFYIQADISASEINADLADEFDHIFSFYCLHWIQDQRQCAKNLHKLLKPGGDILITFLAKNPIFEVYEKLSKYKKWLEYTKDYKTYIAPYQNSEDPASELEKTLTSAGFDVQMCEVIDRSYTFNDVSVWKKSIIAVNPFLPRIPAHLKDEYIEDFIGEVKLLNCLIRDDNNNEEKISFHYKLFVVNATKPL